MFLLAMLQENGRLASVVAAITGILFDGKKACAVLMLLLSLTGTWYLLVTGLFKPGW